jgi:hypothetical protein
MADSAVAREVQVDSVAAAVAAVLPAAVAQAEQAEQVEAQPQAADITILTQLICYEPAFKGSFYFWPEISGY